MFQIDNFNKIFFPMEIVLYSKDGSYYLVDYLYHQTIPLTQDKKNLHGTVKRDDDEFDFYINQFSLLVKNNHDEILTIDKNGIVYSKKSADNSYNQFFMEISPFYLVFYVDRIEENRRFGIKTENGLSFMKDSETITKDGLLKKDLILNNKDGVAAKRFFIRQFTPAGSLISSQEFEEELNGSLEDNIRESFSSHEAVTFLKDKLDTSYPGVLSYADANIPLFHDVFAEFYSKSL